MIGAIVLALIGGWYLADSVRDRNPYALIVGLVFVGMCWVIALAVKS